MLTLLYIIYNIAMGLERKEYASYNHGISWQPFDYIVQERLQKYMCDDRINQEAFAVNINTLYAHLRGFHRQYAEYPRIGQDIIKAVCEVVIDADFMYVLDEHKFYSIVDIPQVKTLQTLVSTIESIYRDFVRTYKHIDYTSMSPAIFLTGIYDVTDASLSENYRQCLEKYTDDQLLEKSAPVTKRTASFREKLYRLFI